ncbi:hypothetical protein Anapl_01453 [Anas platyrhynchos]|uniref:Uncharacterized protein n=1 Tax=Anas platyrhynchos TaxID=8839 RepID=R0LRZ8_ANAPL|nr:hypothetical protein Anapl_01453 [Anas platyrhynchos]
MTLYAEYLQSNLTKSPQNTLFAGLKVNKEYSDAVRNMIKAVGAQKTPQLTVNAESLAQGHMGFPGDKRVLTYEVTESQYPQFLHTPSQEPSEKSSSCCDYMVLQDIGPLLNFCCCSEAQQQHRPRASKSNTTAAIAWQILDIRRTRQIKDEGQKPTRAQKGCVGMQVSSPYWSPNQTRSKLRSPTRFCDSILEIFLLYNVCGVGETQEPHSRRPGAITPGRRAISALQGRSRRPSAEEGGLVGPKGSQTNTQTNLQVYQALLGSSASMQKQYYKPPGTLPWMIIQEPKGSACISLLPNRCPGTALCTTARNWGLCNREPKDHLSFQASLCLRSQRPDSCRNYTSPFSSRQPDENVFHGTISKANKSKGCFEAVSNILENAYQQLLAVQKGSVYTDAQMLASTSPKGYLLEKDKLTLFTKLNYRQKPGKPYFTGRRETYIYKVGQNGVYVKPKKSQSLHSKQGISTQRTDGRWKDLDSGIMADRVSSSSEGKKEMWRNCEDRMGSPLQKRHMKCQIASSTEMAGGPQDYTQEVRTSPVAAKITEAPDESPAICSSLPFSMSCLQTNQEAFASIRPVGAEGQPGQGRWRNCDQEQLCLRRTGRKVPPRYELLEYDPNDKAG